MNSHFRGLQSCPVALAWAAMRSSLLALPLIALVVSCGNVPTRAVTLRFSGRVGDAPFACGGTFAGVGTTGTTFTGLDFRLYVHDVALLTADGRVVPLALSGDGVWQALGVALLDFEAGAGCEEGNAPTNVLVRGTVPDDGATYAGVRFRLGVPAALDHLDADNQPSPLNVTSMFWGWNDGYKYFRVDGRTTGQPGGIRFHLGATACTGDPRAGTRVCANENTPEIRLDGLDVEHDTIVVDVAGLFAASDLDHDAGGAAGCMSDPDDPDCASMLAAVGLGGAQSTFRVEHGGI